MNSCTEYEKEFRPFLHSELHQDGGKLYCWPLTKMHSKALSSFLLLLAVVIAVEGLQNDSLPAVTLKVNSAQETQLWLNWTDSYVKSTTNGLISTIILNSGDLAATKAALKEGRIDVAISAHPFSQAGTDVDFMHFPIATGGIVFYANLGEDRTISFSAKQMALILTGTAHAWNETSLYENQKWMSQLPHSIKLFTWGPNSTETKQVRAFLEKNTEGYFNPMTKFSSTAVELKTMEDAIQKVKNTPGAITWAPYQTKLEHFIPIQLFVIQTDDYVSPTIAGFKNALMPFKKASDIPRQENTDVWVSWTLTDMTKMPPDGSCMSMPPYALSRFYYAIIRRDQTASTGHKYVVIVKRRKSL